MGSDPLTQPTQGVRALESAAIKGSDPVWGAAGGPACAAKVMRMTGELVMGRFRLLERIGSGGMGTVYRAFDERLQRHVAVKEVMVGDPDRVLREAQAAARLNHPGIVALFELGAEGHRAL